MKEEKIVDVYFDSFNQINELVKAATGQVLLITKEISELREEMEAFANKKELESYHKDLDRYFEHFKEVGIEVY